MGIQSFPQEFMWGVATSSHQIEGAFRAGGRGESIWDRFAATPGKIADGSDASIACDHYHRWREDIELLRWLGVGAYRFSIAWPRIIPAGRGVINERGLDFYDGLVDGLLDAGIQPFVTLYHWDLPQVLEDRGGWGARSTAEAFAEYADAVAARLGDRVRYWITHNEPWCVATLGHEHGEHAPGHKDPRLALRVAHHVLLSHGWAVDVIRQRLPDAQLGITLNLTPAYAATDSAADRNAARDFDGAFNRWYLDPLLRGSYPEDAVADRVRKGHLESAELDFVEPDDLETISTPMDFLGVNYYSRVVMKAEPSGDPAGVAVVPDDVLTAMGWEVYPQGLYDLLRRLERDYETPRVVITENGAAYPDTVGATGRIADEARVDYFQRHLAAVHRALTDGVPLGGYFAWSLMDNFEWAHGYAKRFGLYSVDYDTQVRTAKDSAYWYRDVIAARAVEAAAEQSS